MKRVRLALQSAELTPLQCRMVWILFRVNGEKCALEFIEKVKEQKR